MLGRHHRQVNAQAGGGYSLPFAAGRRRPEGNISTRTDVYCVRTLLYGGFLLWSSSLPAQGPSGWESPALPCWARP